MLDLGDTATCEGREVVRSGGGVRSRWLFAFGRGKMPYRKEG